MTGYDIEAVIYNRLHAGRLLSLCYFDSVTDKDTNHRRQFITLMDVTEEGHIFIYFRCHQSRVTSLSSECESLRRAGASRGHAVCLRRISLAVNAELVGDNGELIM